MFSWPCRKDRFWASLTLAVPPRPDGAELLLVRPIACAAHASMKTFFLFSVKQENKKNFQAEAGDGAGLLSGRSTCAEC